MDAAMKYQMDADKYRNSYSLSSMSAMYNAAVSGASGQSASAASGSPGSGGSDSPSMSSSANSSAKSPMEASSAFQQKMPNYLDPLGRNYLDHKAYFDSSKLYSLQDRFSSERPRFEHKYSPSAEGSTGSRSPNTPEAKHDDSASPPSGILPYYPHHQGLLPMSQYAAVVAGHHYKLAAAAAGGAAGAALPSAPSSTVGSTPPTTSPPSSASGTDLRRPLTVIF